MDNRRLGELLAKSFDGRKIEGRLGAWRIDLSEEDVEQEPAPDEDLTDEPPADDEEEEAETEEEDAAPGAGERLPALLIVLTDERADRMRIMMPIRPFDPERVDDLRLALIALHANYDRALDARYAVQDGVLWSVFIHPLGSLTPADLENALAQVRRLRETTGTTYSSSDMLFGGGGRGGRPAPEPDDQRDDVI